MPRVRRQQQNGRERWLLEGEELHPGNQVELRVHGDGGWLPAEVVDTGLDAVVVRFFADDGKPLVTSLADEDELRWAGSPDAAPGVLA